MLKKLNNKLSDLNQEINNMKVKESDDVYSKLCDCQSDLEAFQLKIKDLMEWVNAGIKFLK